MNRLMMFLALMVIVSFSVAGAAEQTTCPVSGEPIDESVFTEYNGEKVYFCCADCKEAFEANPEKYMEKVHAEKGTDDGVQLQTMCPVMGGAINKDLYADHEGKRVYFCCQSCVGKFEEDPAKYIKTLEDDGITVAHLQTTCPVMGGKINKDHYVDYNDKRVYFCCPGCDDTFLENDPDQTIKDLEAEGVVFEEVSNGN